MNTNRMVELALKRAVELEQAGDFEKANRFLELAIGAEEREKKKEKNDGNKE